MNNNMNIQYYNLKQLKEKLAELPFSSPVAILSKEGAKRWGIDSFLSREQEKGKLLWLSRIDSNPTQVTLRHALDSLRDYNADGIIAIGGGSAIDLAKALSAFYRIPGLESPELLTQAIKDKGYLGNSHQALPIIAVPSTAGTGSEVTQWATIWDADDCAKYSVDAPWLKPETAWIVPELISSLPARMMLSSGLDAVCHAAESYWSKAGNPLSKAMAVRSLQIMVKKLKPTILDPQNEELQKELCTGSLLAGLAFSMTRTTACHSISYPLTSLFGVEHGFAAAMTLSSVAETNHKACDITEIREIFLPYGGIQAWIDSVCEGITCLRLKEFGIAEQDLDRIIGNSFSAGRMDNNPVNLSIEDVRLILRTVL